jgi:DNA-binding Lrp family transcriptional regulator
MSIKKIKHIFDQLPKIVRKHPELTPKDKIVFLEIYDVLKDKPYACHRNETLAKATNLSVRTIARVLNTLERLGILIREGISFNRRFFLGKLFTVSEYLYTKITQTKKNLSTCAKKVVGMSQVGKHTKNFFNKNYNKAPSEEETIYKWYKDNSNVEMPAYLKDLFPEPIV